jgi:hypothetical protein
LTAFVKKSDARIELWVARHALLDSGHSNQYQANTSCVEDRPHLLKADHFKTIGFIHLYLVSRRKIDLSNRPRGQNIPIKRGRRQSRRTAGQDRDTAAGETT